MNAKIFVISLSMLLTNQAYSQVLDAQETPVKRVQKHSKNVSQTPNQKKSLHKRLPHHQAKLPWIFLMLLLLGI